MFQTGTGLAGAQAGEFLGFWAHYILLTSGLQCHNDPLNPHILGGHCQEQIEEHQQLRGGKEDMLCLGQLYCKVGQNTQHVSNYIKT